MSPLRPLIGPRSRRAWRRRPLGLKLCDETIGRPSRSAMRRSCWPGAPGDGRRRGRGRYWLRRRQLRLVRPRHAADGVEPAPLPVRPPLGALPARWHTLPHLALRPLGAFQRPHCPLPQPARRLGLASPEAPPSTAKETARRLGPASPEARLSTATAASADSPPCTVYRSVSTLTTSRPIAVAPQM